MNKLRLTNGALKRLQAEHGIDLYAGGIQAEGPGQIMSKYTAVYWAARLHEKPDLTIEEATAETDAMTPGDVMRIVNEAVRESMMIDTEAPAADAGTKSE